MLRTLKWDFIAASGFFNANIVFRIGFSALIIYLFRAVAEGKYTISYIYVAILILLWYLSQLMMMSANVVSYILASKIKASMALLLYAKVSKMTSYVIKSTEIGKITNLIATDLGVVEMRLMTVLMATSYPLFLVGITILLITRIGWAAIVGIIIVLLFIPITGMISKKNGDTIVEINKHKDRRVQITAETIEGIKYVKLYGWELAFRRIIQRVRDS
jgi:ABC-type multidrug transport system fused ATPase/permease subunit